MKLNDDTKQCLNDIVDDNCMLTLPGINRELRRRPPISRKSQIHDRTVGRILDGMLVSLKLAKPLPLFFFFFNERSVVVWTSLHKGNGKLILSLNFFPRHLDTQRKCVVYSYKVWFFCDIRYETFCYVRRNF